jgi:hypothetical protein
MLNAATINLAQEITDAQFSKRIGFSYSRLHPPS